MTWREGENEMGSVGLTAWIEVSLAARSQAGRGMLRRERACRLRGLRTAGGGTRGCACDGNDADARVRARDDNDDRHVRAYPKGGSARPSG